jgi:hypothetical protein
MPKNAIFFRAHFQTHPKIGHACGLHKENAACHVECAWMARKFPAGAFSFEIEGDEIRLIYNNRVVAKKILPLLLDDLPVNSRSNPLGKWSAAWYHLLAFDPEKAEELRILASKSGHD